MVAEEEEEAREWEVECGLKWRELEVSAKEVALAVEGVAVEEEEADKAMLVVVVFVLRLEEVWLELSEFGAVVVVVAEEEEEVEGGGGGGWLLLLIK